MPRQIISGEPGTTWTNETGKVMYQFHANWVNTCGLCCQFDGMIGPSWSIPLHRSCRCRQSLVAPGKTSQPFTDFRETIARLPPAEQSKVVGRSNLTLIEKGIVGWDDVVTRTRVRDFREVVARKRLGVKELVAGGVPERLARQAYEAVHTPAHEIAAAHRQDLVAKVLAKGVERDELRKALAERLAGRVGIGSGPSGPGTLPVRPSTPRPPASGTTSRRISASPERMYSPVADPARQYLGSLGVKPEAIAAVAPKPAPASSAPILPGRPIAERIAAYEDGRERVKRLATLGEHLDPLEKELTAQAARVDAAMAKYAKAKGEKARQRARGEMEAEQAAYREAHARHEKALEETRRQAREILATGGRFHLGVDAPKLDDAQFAAVAEGSRWMQQNVAPVGDGGPMTIAVGPVGAREELRSYATKKGIKMAVADPSIYVHEAAHYFDSHDSGMLRSSREFLQHRVGDEQPTPLREVLAGDYHPSETGRKDRFDEALGDRGWYAGKRYPDLYTEIHSMGFEEMYRNPARFAAKDPEFATYILGIMHGPLR